MATKEISIVERTASIAAIIKETADHKVLQSSKYNYYFSKENGLFIRWGETKDDDPNYSDFGPEIMDIEISTGECTGNCSFCYKANGSKLESNNMSLEEFKLLFSKLPKTLTQIAFGITDIGTNPDFWNILEFAKSKGVIPNYTCNGFDITREIADQTAKVCGAVAVSIYDRKYSFAAAKLFLQAGVPQVNFHFMLSNETFDEAIRVIDEIKDDPDLNGIYALVFLQYKPKGRGISHFSPLDDSDKIRIIMEYARVAKINLGFDSCSAPLVFRSLSSNDNRDNQLEFVEPCESGLFSLYANVHGEVFPCSFIENTKDWANGISLLERDTNFIQDVWFGEKLSKWREMLLKTSKGCDCPHNSICRNCPIYSTITPCKNDHSVVQTLKVVD